MPVENLLRRFRYMLGDKSPVSACVLFSHLFLHRRLPYKRLHHPTVSDGKADERFLSGRVLRGLICFLVPLDPNVGWDPIVAVRVLPNLAFFTIPFFGQIIETPIFSSIPLPSVYSIS